jgi:hypothetical protein
MHCSTFHRRNGLSKDIAYKYCGEHNMHIWADGTEFSFQKIERIYYYKSDVTEPASRSLCCFTQDSKPER